MGWFDDLSAQARNVIVPQAPVSPWVQNGVNSWVNRATGQMVQSTVDPSVGGIVAPKTNLLGGDVTKDTQAPATVNKPDLESINQAIVHGAYSNGPNAPLANFVGRNAGNYTPQQMRDLYNMIGIDTSGMTDAELTAAKTNLVDYSNSQKSTGGSQTVEDTITDYENSPAHQASLKAQADSYAASSPRTVDRTDPSNPEIVGSQPLDTANKAALDAIAADDAYREKVGAQSSYPETWNAAAEAANKSAKDQPGGDTADIREATPSTSGPVVTPQINSENMENKQKEAAFVPTPTATPTPPVENKTTSSGTPQGGLFADVRQNLANQSMYQGDYNKKFQEYMVNLGTYYGQNATDYGRNATNFSSPLAQQQANAAMNQASSAARTQGLSPAQAALLGANTTVSSYADAMKNYMNQFQSTAKQVGDVANNLATQSNLAGNLTNEAIQKNLNFADTAANTAKVAADITGRTPESMAAANTATNALTGGTGQTTDANKSLQATTGTTGLGTATKDQSVTGQSTTSEALKG